MYVVSLIGIDNAHTQNKQDPSMDQRIAKRGPKYLADAELRLETEFATIGGVHAWEKTNLLVSLDGDLYDDEATEL